MGSLVKMREHAPFSPLTLAVLAALTISFSAILVKASGATPSTAAIFRCLYALPFLAVLAWRERARRTPMEPPATSARRPALAAASGVFLAFDLICWHHSIEDLGAGLATVLGNLQIAFLPLIAWIVLSERPGRRMLVTLPLALAGVLLISGVLEHGAYGSNPSAGGLFGLLTGLTYSVCLLLLRGGSRGPRNTAEPLFLATLTATATAIVVGLALGEAQLVPSWPSAGWLLTLALGSQVLGWLLITRALPQLPAAITSIVLTIQPVGSMCLAVLIFGERPSSLQLLGLLLILSGLLSIALPTGAGAGPPEAQSEMIAA
ncbi:MAG TPA: DMT family transporter [Solirubrobacteraceae bacterium]|jgi:drug/metabolite transporter (DMT)-like permease